MTINFVVDFNAAQPIYHTTVLDGIEYPRELAVQEDKAVTYGDGDSFKWIMLMEAKDSKSFYLMEFTYSIISQVITLTEKQRRPTKLEHLETATTNMLRATFLDKQTNWLNYWVMVRTHAGFDQYDINNTFLY